MSSLQQRYSIYDIPHAAIETDVCVHIQADLAFFATHILREYGRDVEEIL